MPGILEDKDRIFTNLYGFHDWGLEGAKQRGAWNATSDMIAFGRDWVMAQIKNSGLRGRGGRRVRHRAEVDLHAQGRASRPSPLSDCQRG